MHILQYVRSDEREVKAFILGILKKYGYTYDSNYHYDLDDPHKHYIDSGGMLYVLKRDNKIVGTIAIRNKGKIAELKRFYIKEDLRGKGFGSKLLKEVVGFCKGNKIDKIILETDKYFMNAQLFYQKKGFKIVKEDDKRFYMEKQL